MLIALSSAFCLLTKLFDWFADWMGGESCHCGCHSSSMTIGQSESTLGFVADGVAFQLSYYAAIFRAGERASRGGVHYGMYLVPRAATGWPPGSGGQRHMKDGLFRKIMTFIGQGAKAIKYFIFGPE